VPPVRTLKPTPRRPLRARSRTMSWQGDATFSRAP